MGNALDHPRLLLPCRPPAFFKIAMMLITIPAHRHVTRVYLRSRRRSLAAAAVTVLQPPDTPPHKN